MDKIIDEYTNQYRTIFHRVKSYDDLIALNIAFLNCELHETPTRSRDIREETFFVQEDLIEVNKAGFYSKTGQPAMYHKDFAKGEWFEMDRKPYLCGYLPMEYYDKFSSFMKKTDKFYCIVYSYKTKDLLLSTLPVKRYNVARGRSHPDENKLQYQEWTINTYFYVTASRSMADYSDYPNIDALLQNTVYVEIIGRDYHIGSTEQLLLEFFTKHT